MMKSLLRLSHKMSSTQSSSTKFNKLQSQIDSNPESHKGLHSQELHSNSALLSHEKLHAQVGDVLGSEIQPYSSNELDPELQAKELESYSDPAISPSDDNEYSQDQDISWMVEVRYIFHHL